MEFGDFAGFCLCHVDNKKMGGILREQRVTQNMTQQQVADKAKITLQQYQKFESDARNIRTASFQLTCRVLEALKMDIAAFYHGDYSIGEEIFIEKGMMKYKRTGRGIDEDAPDADGQIKE